MASVTPTEDRPRYHHGDLRNALVATATELARASGPEAVTVRESARRIGVSPSAAYRHFTDQADLLAAVAAAVLRELAIRMRDAIFAVPTTDQPAADALNRFRAVGLAYVHYALEAPGLYRTGYAPGVVLPGTTDNMAEPPSAGLRSAGTGDHPYTILAVALDDLVAEGVLAPERRKHAEVAAWAGVHGLAMLVNDGVLGNAAADPGPLIDTTLDMIGIGLCAPITGAVGGR